MDFQVYARPGGLASEQRPVNEALFTTYESVRLWLKEHETKAPFRKVVVTFADETSSARWHGKVSNALGICEVTEAVDMAMLVQKAGDHRWVLGIVEHALGCVERSTGWRSDELWGFIREVSERTLPLVHFFEGLAQVDNASGVKCVPWLSARPGETQIGVRIGKRDVTVLSQPGPLYLEDSFPVAKSAIRGHEYVLLDKAGKSLASVAIDSSTLHSALQADGHSSPRRVSPPCGERPSPIRAAAAKVPVLLAHDAAVRPAATVRVGAGPSPRPELVVITEHVCDGAAMGTMVVRDDVRPTPSAPSTRTTAHSISPTTLPEKGPAHHVRGGP